MKKIYPFIMICVICILMSRKVVFAETEQTGLITEPLSAESLDVHGKITMMEQMVDGLKIECFAVSEQGLIAVGSAGSSDTKYIGIYDGTGSYQYGYICQVSGTYALDWDGDNLLFYSGGKEQKLFSVNPDGVVESVEKVTSDSKNDSYVQWVMRASKKVYGDKTYKLCNRDSYSIFDQRAYSQLILVDADGKETLIYDANYNPIPYIIVGLGCLVFVVIVFSIAYKIQKSEREE